MITLKIRCTVALMLQVCLSDEGTDLNILSGDAVLAFTYAKIYYLGGGWYAISGYHHSGEDVHDVIKKLKEFKDYERTPEEDFIF
jgi:hypothetical protein